MVNTKPRMAKRRAVSGANSADAVCPGAMVTGTRPSPLNTVLTCEDGLWTSNRSSIVHDAVARAELQRLEYGVAALLAALAGRSRLLDRLLEDLAKIRRKVRRDHDTHSSQVNTSPFHDWPLSGLGTEDALTYQLVLALDTYVVNPAIVTRMPERTMPSDDGVYGDVSGILFTPTETPVTGEPTARSVPERSNNAGVITELAEAASARKQTYVSAVPAFT